MTDLYITSEDDLILMQAVNDELEKAGRDQLGISIASADKSAITEHCKIIKSKDGTLSYYWDDMLLLKTSPTQTTKGVRIETQ